MKNNVLHNIDYITKIVIDFTSVIRDEFSTEYSVHNIIRAALLLALFYLKS